MCEEDTLNELRASVVNLRKLLFALEERVEKMEKIHEETKRIIDKTWREILPDHPYG